MSELPHDVCYCQKCGYRWRSRTGCASCALDDAIEQIDRLTEERDALAEELREIKEELKEQAMERDLLD